MTAATSLVVYIIYIYIYIYICFFIVQGGFVTIRDPLSPSDNKTSTNQKRKAAQSSGRTIKRKTHITVTPGQRGNDGVARRMSSDSPIERNSSSPFSVERHPERSNKRGAHYKTQMCVFQRLHPDGCVFSDESLCNYKHRGEL